MKRSLFIILFVVFIAGLFAQTGLLGLSFGQDYLEAKSYLTSNGFVIMKDWPVTKSFGFENPETYYMVEMYVNPETSKLVGWTVRFLENITTEQYDAIFAESILLHGGKCSIDKEQGMVGWNLDKTKSFTLSLDEKGNLSMGVYYDDNFASVMDRANETP